MRLILQLYFVLKIALLSNFLRASEDGLGLDLIYLVESWANCWGELLWGVEGPFLFVVGRVAFIDLKLVQGGSVTYLALCWEFLF